MEVNYVHKDSTTLVQDELVKNELNQIELQYNALRQQKFNELLKENEELKLELSGYRQAILNNKEMLGLKEQNQELKKQLEAYETYFNRFFKINNKTYDGKIVLELLNKKETQQKEFIKWLEDYLKLFDNMDIEEQASYDAIEEILQKYKEIIGDDK